MPKRPETIARLFRTRVIPVIRADNAEAVMPICEALLEGGLNALEITMTTPQALELVREAKKRFADAVIGVGTVMSDEICRQAIDAGAEFVVTPILLPKVAKAAQQADCVCLLGAFTATEAQAAHETGADFVKIFPAMGPAYVSALLGPLPHLQVVPTSGVNLKTGPEFFAAGCPMVGVGSALVSPKIIAEKNWAELSRLAGQFREMALNATHK